jgi:hypothetical protein
MSKWMSIGFDPDQMDPVRAPDAQAAISGAGEDAAQRQTGGLGLNASSKHSIARAMKRLVARHRKLRVPAWKL